MRKLAEIIFIFHTFMEENFRFRIFFEKSFMEVGREIFWEEFFLIFLEFFNGNWQRHSFKRDYLIFFGFFGAIFYGRWQCDSFEEFF